MTCSIDLACFWAAVGCLDRPSCDGGIGATLTNRGGVRQASPRIRQNLATANYGFVAAAPGCVVGETSTEITFGPTCRITSSCMASSASPYSVIRVFVPATV